MQLQEMQNEVNRFFRSLNVDTTCVFVFENRHDIAKASGLYARGTIPLLNVNVNAAFGLIYTNVDYLNRNLSVDQQKFVLAHETSHIYLNHVVPVAVDKLIDEVIRYYDRDIHTIVNIAKIFLYMLGVPLPLPALIKEQEIAADIQAILLTGNEDAAKSCLTKLVGGNLDSWSHTWEALGIKMPVMTMRERLQEIQRRMMSLSQYH